MRVKICGIKSIEDAIAAINYGADAVGVLVGQLHPSDDFVSEVQAKEIINSLPPYCSSVMVTHLTDINEISRIAKYIGATTVQLHGNSTPEDARQLKEKIPYLKIYKSIHVNNEAAIAEAKEFANSADAIILDTANAKTGQVGGTGMTHDWSISQKIISSINLPVILAGGLNPENVVDAIKRTKPFAVDVNSGVKANNGFKDLNKLEKFIRMAKIGSI